MAPKKVTIHEHHRRWGIWIALLVFIAACAVVAIAFARDGRIDSEPWGYVALAVAILSAVGGFVLTFAQAAFESQGDE